MLVYQVLATRGKTEAMQEFVENQRHMKNDLTELCAEADYDKDGKLSEEEWQKAMQNDKLINYLDLMGTTFGPN